MKWVVLLLLVAASVSSGQLQPAGVVHCEHDEDATFDVDISLGEWQVEHEMNSTSPVISFNFSKKKPEEIAEYRNQYANATTAEEAVDWSRVTLYCEVTSYDNKFTYLVEILNSNGLVRFIPIDETLPVKMGSIRPPFLYIQNVRDTLLVHVCGNQNEVPYVMYKRPHHLSDRFCNGFGVNATFDPNISLGEWVAADDKISSYFAFELIAKTPDEIATYRLKLKDTPVVNMSINWNRVNLFGNITYVWSSNARNTITFVIELFDSTGAGRIFPVGKSLELALRSPRFVIPEVQFRNMGKKLGMMICNVKVPTYFSRKQEGIHISESVI